MFMNRFLRGVIAASGIALTLGTTQAQAQVAQAYYGRLNFAITITLSTAVPSGDSVLCSADASVSDPTNSTNSEHFEALATVSGSTATCNLTIPYEWLLSTPGSDSISATYGVSIVSTTSATVGFARSGTHGLPTVTGVPVSGSVTSYTAQTRL
jgi:hypothetical protein